MKDNVEFREPDIHHAAQVWTLIKNCPPLDLNSEYQYLLLCYHFYKTCIIATNESKVVGFISAYVPPQKPDTLFIWQVAVDKRFRKKKLATRMAEKLLARDYCHNISYVEATVTPSNRASRRFFQLMAEKYHGNFNVHPLFTKPMFASSKHEKEKLVRIGPIKKNKKKALSKLP